MITSTVDGYQRLADMAAGERERAWSEVYEAAYPEVFSTYYGGWSKPEQQGRLASDVCSLSGLVREREERAHVLIERASDGLRDRGLIDRALDAVLLVGNGTANGWAADWRGRTTLYLALELLPEPPFDEALVAHESVHVAHLEAGDVPDVDRVGATLFAEGLAVAVSRTLVPALNDSAYLWFDDDHIDWERRSEKQKTDIRGACSDLASADPVLRKALFGRPADSALPPRCGYWLGDRLIQQLLATSSVSSLLAWDVSRVEAELAALIERG